MLRLGLKSLRANKIRFALTASTVMIGVAFVVAAFVTADSLRSTFGDLAEDINTGSDFTIRGELAFGDITTAIPPRVPDELLDEIVALEGVDAAVGGIFVDGVTPVDGSGNPVTSFGAPVAGTNWDEDSSISQFYLIDGQWPVGGQEFALDTVTYADNDFEIGSQYEVVTPTGPHTFTLTGTMQFGFPDNAGAGATFIVFETPTAQEVLGAAGEFDQIAVRGDLGVDLEDLRLRMEAVLPPDTEIISAAEATEEFNDAFESFIGPFQTILLVFAFVVLFVSGFIISNTFSIVLGQRVRELSLLRAVGATPRQVRRSVLTESLAIGVAAWLAGLGVGMLGALGIRGLFAFFASGLPQGPLPLTPRTVIWAAIVGIGFTVLASFVPAVKASRISPIAGLHEGAGSTDGRAPGKARPIFGGVLLAVGLVLTGLGLFGDFESATPQLTSLGAGAAIVFVGVAVLSPLVAGGIVGLLTTPLPMILGTSGVLARNNSIRNPRRTAATAVALTIGLALVTMVSVVGQSLKVSFGERLSTAVSADFVMTSQGQAGMPVALIDDLDAAGIGTVVSFDYDRVRVVFDSAGSGGAGSGENGITELETDLTVTDFGNLSEVADLDVSSGAIPVGGDASTGLALGADVADKHGLNVGDRVQLDFVSGDSVIVEVRALFEGDALWSPWIVDRSLYSPVSTSDFVDFILVAASGDDAEASRTAVADVVVHYPQVTLEDRQEFQASLESNLNVVLTIANVFLGFSLLIALIGIVNTLTLSVFERTREIGLLRAVGMSARQLRRMIRWEAVAVAFYGALVGVALGLAFGIATAIAIPDGIIDKVSIPIVQLGIFLLISVFFGLFAALFPAFRASRMNVLDAIADE